MRSFRKKFLSNDKSRAEVINELLDAAKNGVITLIVGAGISKASPASLPLAGELVKEACHVISTMLRIPLDTLLTHSGEVMRLEPFLRLVEVICSVKNVEAFLDVLRNGKPNINHRAIALLLRDYEGSKIISLNFDFFVEESLRDLKILAKAIVPKEKTVETVIPVPYDPHLVAKTHELVKPHGSLIQNGGTSGFVATIQKLGTGLPQPLQQKILDYINGRILLITGYSDDDIDLFPLIQTTSPQAVYWNSLGNELPTKVRNWFADLPLKIPTTQLIGKCEYLFQEFPRLLVMQNVVEDPPLLRKQLDDWAKGIDNIAKIAAIAAWLAQDRHRIDMAIHLYNLALIQEDCISDLSLCRFIRYRYAELLRHQATDKKSALKEYFMILVGALKKPLEPPIFIVVIRSLASQLRSAFHHTPFFLGIFPSIISVLLFWLVSFLIRITPEKHWRNSRLFRDKEGTWINWEYAMIFLGYAIKIPWPIRIRNSLLVKTLNLFKLAENSNDLYEKSAAIFGQARTMAALAWLWKDSNYSQNAYRLLEDAFNLFKILDDVTGLENTVKLRQAIGNISQDPWLDS